MVTTDECGLLSWGLTLPISLTLTPPLPSPFSVITSGGLKVTIVHLTRLGMPLTSTMDSTTVPLSRVSGSLEAPRAVNAQPLLVSREIGRRLPGHLRRQRNIH